MVFLRPLVRYADFKGRARRAEYWGFLLFQLAVGGLLGGLGVIALLQKDAAAQGSGLLISMALLTVASLGFAIPQLAVTVRRLHDSDRSAWWLLLQAPGALAPFLFIAAVVGAALHGGQGSADAAAAIMSAAAGGLLMLVLAGLCNMIMMGLMWLPGTPGDNRFGPDPRGPGGRGGAEPPRYGGIDEARLDEMFAQARSEAGGPEPAPAEARWKPDLDFGGRVAPAPAPVARPAAAWPEAPSGPTFGRRNR